MTMRYLYALLITLLFISTPVFAQDQAAGESHQPPSADDIVSRMQSKLDLTQDQITAVTPIIEKYATKREDLRQSMEDGTADKDSIRVQMKQLHEDEKQDLSQVLSADQLSQWEQMQAQDRHRRENDDKGAGNMGGTSNNSSNENTSSGPGE